MSISAKKKDNSTTPRLGEDKAPQVGWACEECIDECAVTMVQHWPNTSDMPRLVVPLKVSITPIFTGENSDIYTNQLPRSDKTEPS